MTDIRAMVRRSVAGMVVLAAGLFLPAGTFDWWQAWLFLLLFTAMTGFIGLYLARHDPALLQRRLEAGPGAETRPAQKRIIRLLMLVFIAMPVLAGLDRRFGWSDIPAPLSLAGDALVVLGLLIAFRVLAENSYGASTIRLMEGQQVIDSGPYAWVRHPMYSGALLMTIGMPPALGCWWALLLVPPVMALLGWRILDEEAMLRQELRGYTEYMRRVRFRLCPGLW